MVHIRLNEAEHGVAASNPTYLALVAFSSAFAECADEMVDLFDAMLSITIWPAPTATVASA